MKVMKSKDIHFAVKKDDGISYLMERFGFQEKDDLFDAIRRVTPSGAEELIRRLEKKEKCLQRREKNNGTADDPSQKEIHQDECSVQEPEEDVVAIISNTDVEFDTVEMKEEKMQKLPDIE